MLKTLMPPGLRSNPEYQSAIVRLSIWLFILLYIGFGAVTEYYRVDYGEYTTLFFFYLFVFLGLFISVRRRPEWPARRYVSLAVDVSATSFAIFLTKDSISPLYLLYIWIFVSYGTRYGKPLLTAASLASILAYGVVVYVLGDYKTHSFEAFFFLLLLVLLPLYQYSLLRRLQEAKQAAEQANAARGRFLATMTHELRTPLSGVIGMARLMAGTPLNETQRDQLQALLTSADTLEQLIGDILDLSKIDARRLQLESQPFDIRDLAVQVSSDLALRAADKGVDLILDIDDALPLELLGDALRVRQILINLLGNAVKFTDRGEVRLLLRRAPAGQGLDVDHLYLQVMDTGIGIPSDKLERIFDAFEQADNSTTRRYGGSGLGTAIARDLVTLMNGQIGVDSEEGKGSCFWVRLPLLPEQEQPLRLPLELRGKRVLLYEGNHSLLRVLENQCRAMGMQVTPIQAREQLLASQSDGGFDLIIAGDGPRDGDLRGIGDWLRRQCGEDIPLLYLAYPQHSLDGHAEHELLLHKPFSSRDLGAALLALLQPQSSPADSAQATAEPDASGCKLRILVAEDDPISAKLITTLLAQQGCRAILVEDGDSALHEVRSGGYDLAFVDVRMPRVDGMQFARKLRSEEAAGTHLPLIALTANAADDVKQECLDAGMDDFLTKPVNPEILSGLLRKYAG